MKGIESFPEKTMIKGREVSCQPFTRPNSTCENRDEESFGCVEIR